LWPWERQQQVGLMVNRGAENGIRKKARELLGEATIED
jgi:hypothetical protein